MRPHRRNAKERILKVALRLFVDKGIRGTTTRTIAERAGISEATIYRHFTNKDDLAKSLFMFAAHRLREELIAAATRSTDPREKIIRIAEAMFRFHDEHPLHYTYIISNHPRDFGKLPREFPKPKDVFVDIIREGMAEGTFEAGDPALAASWVIGMIQKAIFFAENNLLDTPPDEVVAETKSAILRALSARETESPKEEHARC